MPRIFRIFAVNLLLLWGGVIPYSLSFAQNTTNTTETISFETYYPSPYGAYNELTVESRQAIGDVNGDGKVDSNDMAVDTFGNPIVGSLTVSGNVSIGTVSPAYRLNVQGKIGGTLDGGANNGELKVNCPGDGNCYAVYAP